MKIPKESKGGYVGQINKAAGEVRAGVKSQGKKKKARKPPQGIPGIPDKQETTTRVHGQPKGSTTGMPDSMLSRLRPPKKGF